MRVKLLKPLLVDDNMYGQYSIVEIKDLGRYRYLVGMGHIEDVQPDTELTLLPPPLPTKLSDAEKMSQAAAVIANALSKGIVTIQDPNASTEN